MVVVVPDRSLVRSRERAPVLELALVLALVLAPVLEPVALTRVELRRVGPRRGWAQAGRQGLAEAGRQGLGSSWEFASLTTV